METSKSLKLTNLWHQLKSRIKMKKYLRGEEQKNKNWEIKRK